jgi:hypothetical protein
VIDEAHALPQIDGLPVNKALCLLTGLNIIARSDLNR